MNWLAYMLVMHFDAAINADTAFGRWCLEGAGRWAYRDHDFGPPSNSEAK